MKGNYTVYIHIAPNGKKYIGITKQDPIARWKNGYAYRKNDYFFKSIKKYGWDNIKHEILFTDLTKDEAERKEIELIAHYNTTNRNYGYNHDHGGNTIGTHSVATREKLRLSHQGKRPWIKKSEEEKEKHRQYIYARWKDKKERKKLEEAIRIKHGVRVVCVETGKFFKTLVDAGNYYNICGKHIGDCCKGKRYTAGGYHWKRYEEVKI